MRRSYDLRIATELALPQPIAQHDDLAAVGRVFLRREGAAHHHRRAEEPEIRLGYVDSVHLLGNRPGKVEARPAKVVRRNVLNDAASVAASCEIW